MTHPMLPEAATLAVLGLAGLAEWLHARRCHRLANLAFGPAGKPRRWVRAAPFLRVAAMGLLAWGLITLIGLAPRAHHEDEVEEADYRHIVLVMDVSPSMHLKDAGPTLDETRRQRAGQVLTSLFNRIPMREYRVSVVAVYTEAKPLLVDSTDIEVVRHIVERLPLYHAFKPGKTNLLAGLKEAATLARHWNPKSATIAMLTDGDSVAPKGMPRMPASVSSVLIVGVGDTHQGKFIDGHQSRQDSATLRQIANRLGGIYHDGNQKHVTSQAIARLTRSHKRGSLQEFTRREWALLCIMIGAITLAILPLLLSFAGTAWRPGVPIEHTTAT